jgi:mono/diheme cytochrome c family protein
MFSKKRVLITISLMFVALFTCVHAWGFDSADYYERKCASCHSIGGGDDVGPDLKGVTERRTEIWITKFIKDSQAVIQSGDPVANELFVKFKNKKMPAQELSDDDLKELFLFLKAGKAGGSVDYRPAIAPNPYDIAMGKALFTGELKLKGGGPACISCHGGGDVGILGGGSLGPDLIASYPNYGDKSLNKVLSKIAFPTMAEVYNGKKLTEQENYFIRAYFANASKLQKQSVDQTRKFVLVGVLLAVAFLTLLDFTFRNRRKKTRRPY